MMQLTEARVPTGSGSRYLQQLCKHWAHRLPVDFTTEKGRVDFPSGAVVTMIAESDALAVKREVPDGEDVAHMRHIVASHLDRFAFRETPLAFDWK